MIIFLFRIYDTQTLTRLVKIKPNKDKNRRNTTKVTVHGSCCWQVTTRTYGGEKETHNWNNKLEWNDEKTVWVLSIKITEC